MQISLLKNEQCTIILQPDMGTPEKPETPGLIRLLRRDPEFRQFFYDDHTKRLKEYISALEKRVDQLESYNKSYKREVAYLTDIVYDLQESQESLERVDERADEDHVSFCESFGCLDEAEYCCVICNDAVCDEHCVQFGPKCTLCGEKHTFTNQYMCLHCKDSKIRESQVIECMICDRAYIPDGQRMFNVYCNQSTFAVDEMKCQQRHVHGWVCSYHSTEKNRKST